MVLKILVIFSCVMDHLYILFLKYRHYITFAPMQNLPHIYCESITALSLLFHLSIYHTVLITVASGNSRYTEIPFEFWNQFVNFYKIVYWILTGTNLNFWIDLCIMTTSILTFIIRNHIMTLFIYVILDY